MLLFSARDQTVPEIADLTLCDDDTVLYWLKRYEAEVSAGLATKPHSGRPPKSCYPLPSGGHAEVKRCATICTPSATP